MKKQKGQIWLNLGCGVNLAPGFINVDNFFTEKDLKDKKGPFVKAKMNGAKFVKGDMLNLPFPDNYADYIESIDSIEHIAMKDVHKALSEMYRVLKPGGNIGLETTNFDQLADLWAINVKDMPLDSQTALDRYVTIAQVVYGNQAGPGEFHKSAFNPTYMMHELLCAGFQKRDIRIRILPMNSKDLGHVKSYSMYDLSDKMMLTEMMWVQAYK